MTQPAVIKGLEKKRVLRTSQEMEQETACLWTKLEQICHEECYWEFIHNS